ncbi:MAG: hypothetical protein AB7G13_05770 [Lautropia sp.]
MPIVYAYSDLKDLIEWGSHLSRDALHVHIGLLLFIGMAAVFRSPGRFRRALGWLLVITLLGESFDAAIELARGRSPLWLGSAKDIVNTLLWPSILVFAGPKVARLLRLPPLAHFAAGRADQTRMHR